MTDDDNEIIVTDVYSDMIEISDARKEMLCNTLCPYSA